MSAAALTVAVAAGSGCAVGDPQPAATSTPTLAATAPPPHSAPAAAVAQRVGGVVPEAPEGIQLPDGRRVGIRPVGTTDNGLLDVPSDIDVAGWWSGGSRLGDPFGSTLVAAHVDSRTQGLGPFADLLSVHRGDRVYVWSAGLKQAFRIVSLRLRPQGTIGPRSSLHSPDGRRRLTLVTCAGPYDAARGGYQNLAVVTAVPLAKAVRRP
ncbi:class F sortase [Nocardioides anomalus]|uniref:Class F sortase n=1 Tax=Nocardioides anomalus TaxID=2712223 RepID=A0A6G6WCW0_9ACTN|nr:class F sortase [Nocardioides anomalus]QIG42935.1 class F sortase [Nocardioides anomalus]